MRGVFEAERPQADRACPEQEGGSPDAEEPRTASVLLFATANATANMTANGTANGNVTVMFAVPKSEGDL